MEPLELQRLVDGELDVHERRRLLQRCEEEPAQWRRLALSLLEEQSFQKDVTFFANTTSTNLPMETPGVALSTSLESNAKLDTKHPWGQFALAASLLVAVGFLTGYGLNSMGPEVAVPSAGLMESGSKTLADSGGNAGTNQKSLSTSNNSIDSSLPAGQPRAVGELRFASDQTKAGVSDQVGMPLYEVRPDHIQQMMEQQFRQISEWNRQNIKRGVQIDWQPEMIESQLPDGRAVVVPINQWNVRPIGQ
jgi:hypothetical protein